MVTAVLGASTIVHFFNNVIFSTIFTLNTFYNILAAEKTTLSNILGTY
uniref:Uncharacterized protein n=1 Tax=Rhizophora mucronata TaxID=61149 RepID=A0A2P2PN44_RHIMU